MSPLEQVDVILVWWQANHLRSLCQPLVDDLVADAASELLLEAERALTTILVVQKAVPVIEKVGILQIIHFVLIHPGELVELFQLSFAPLSNLFRHHLVDDLKAILHRLLIQDDALARAVDSSANFKILQLGPFLLWQFLPS
mmetsp:Transcript_14533/g.19704  ORF Transcript_14533/g.19704 Transcript_14533/m.19704 type:complete len:142 (-) Transcript_14533:1279-1704(-)